MFCALVVPIFVRYAVENVKCKPKTLQNYYVSNVLTPHCLLRKPQKYLIRWRMILFSFQLQHMIHALANELQYIL